MGTWDLHAGRRRGRPLRLAGAAAEGATAMGGADQSREC